MGGERLAARARTCAPRPHPDSRTAKVGGSPRHLVDIVLGVVRNEKLMRVDDPEVDALEEGDRLLYIRSAGEDRD